jgi:prepilin signal peptidase PulO-like enzyme (type II secretory pathway)
MHNEVACALTVLRRPVYAGGILALTLTFSTVGYARFGWMPRLWWLLPLLIALALIIVLDLRLKLIPDVVTLPAIVYALTLATFGDTLALGSAVLGAITGGGIVLLFAVISRGAVGGGDIKLMAMLGAALEWKSALAVLALSQVAAALVALSLLVGRRAGRRDSLPVGAIIALIGALMLLGGR